MSAVLVTGATGFIGSRLVPALIAAGHDVRSLVRRPEVPRSLAGSTIVRGDVFDLSSMRAAMKGVDAVYYLVHSMGSPGSFEDADRIAALNVANAAAAAGVKRIIYLGGLGEGESLSLHLQSRAEVAQVLASTGVPTTTLRAAMIIGAGGASYEMLRCLVERLPAMITPRWVKTRSQPIAVDDVIAYLVGCLDDERTAGHSFDIGGPEVLTYREMMIRFAGVEGKRRLIIDVPVLTPRLSSYWVNFVTPVSKTVARPLIEGLRNETVVKDDSIRDILTIPLTPYETAVMRALVEAVPGRLESRSVQGIVPEVAKEAFGLPYGPREPGVVYEAHAVLVEGNEEAVWEQVEGVGGRNGWYFLDWGWTIRGWIDRLLGGVGNRRGRPDTLTRGDQVDTWVVEQIERPRDLVLKSEMRMPREARMGLHVRKAPVGSALIQWVEFHPNALTWLYWWAAYPVHRLVFRGLVSAIARRAARTAAGRKDYVRART